MRRRRWIVLLPIGLGVLTMALPVTMWAYGARRLGQERAACREAGMLMTTAELLAGRSVADEENAALLYEQAISLVGRQRDWPEQVQQDWSLTRSSAQQATWSSEQTVAARRVVAHFRKASDLLAQAGGRPKCLFNKTLSLTQDYRPPAVAAVQLGRLESLRARLAAIEGRRQEAIEATESVFALAEALEGEPVVLLVLVRLNLVKQGSRCLSHILSSGSLSAAERGRLLALLPGRSETYDHMQRGINAEIVVLGQPLFRELRKSKNWLTAIIFDFDEAYYLGQCRASWRRASQEAWQRPTAKVESPPRYYLGSMLALGAADTLLGTIDAAVVATDQGRIALWLDRDRQASDEFPVTLGELGLQQGESLPEDPFSGRAYSYRRTEEGYRLWSVGRNGRDQGGSAGGDDIVWEFPLSGSGEESAGPAAAPEAQGRAGTDWQAYWEQRVRKAREQARRAAPK